MSSVMTTAMSGMLGYQSMLDVVSNNISNAETMGFKSSRTDFSDQLYRLEKGAVPAGGTTGGSDPSQIGNGVAVADIAVQFKQGPVQPTGRNLDLAINGNGFFRLKDPNGIEHYSRVGSFTFDSGNPRQMVDTGTGFLVLNNLGAAISPVDTQPAKATTQLDLSGNLSPTSTVALTGSRVSSLFALKRTDGAALTGATPLSATTLARSQPAGPVTVNVFGNAPDGQPYSGQVTLAATATVQDLVNGLNNVLTRPSGFTTQSIATASLDQGNISISGAIPGDKLNVFLGEQAPPAQPVSLAAANAWQYGGGGDVYAWSRLRFTPDSVPTSLKLFTADGTSHEVSAKWFNTGTVTTGTGLPTDDQRTWDMVADVPTGGSLAAGGDSLRGLTFNGDGSQLAPPVGTLTSNWTVGGPSSVAFDTTLLRGYQADALADSTDNTGYAAGTLESISIDQSGVLNGSYSNGKTVPMSATAHQLGLAVFNNTAGLLAEGRNMWTTTANSGAPTLVSAGTGSVNTITAGALEGSNVDMTEEFTKLIVAQRGFQANSKSFQTGDQMLTEAYSLFR